MSDRMRSHPTVNPQGDARGVLATRVSRGAGLLRRIPPHNGSRRAAVRALIGAAAAALVAIVGAGTAGLGGLSSAARLLAQPPPSDTVLYDRTGQVVLADLHPPGYQSYEVSLSAMGRYLPQATVAVEDANFWKEPGVNPRSMARAAWADIRAHAIVEGGSTITQQLVKLRLVGDDHSFTRKLREGTLAMLISSEFSKEQILGMYLNAAFYGNTAYGAEAASRIYFHVHADQLDLAQGALLAGLPQSPTQLDPLTHWAAAKERQHQVLDAMVRAHDITQAEADQAYAEDLSPPDHLFGPVTTDLAPAFVSYVKNELASLVGPDAVAKAGLHVVTSLDWNLQQLAQGSITDTVNANRWRNLTDGALVSMDPQTGQLLAMVGSAGHNTPGGDYNMAVGPPRNPGSAFKIFTYTAAIDSRRYTMVTPIQDVPIAVRLPHSAPYTPENFGRRYFGVCEVRECLGNSLNVPAVQVELGTGIQAVAHQARRMGAPPFQRHDGQYTADAPASSFGPSLTLGGYGETPMQMATGASVLAAQGVLHEPEAVLSVTSRAGQRLYQAGDSGNQVVDARTAFIVSQMLSDPTNRRLVFGDSTPLTLNGYTAAAKTGTTDNFTDAWTVGYTPSLATAVWMGNSDSHPMAPGSEGMQVAAPTWNRFMQGALDRIGRGNEWYVPPSDLDMQWVNGRPAWFLPGTSADTSINTSPPALPSGVSVGNG
ncbi:MAG TPA: transglycosylase domain-containing protein [Candidatus Dormibacteraeota bacterium]|nr:transglycosylase domain-containing protein [Candidatus Dormibacteraeota bacterium]